MCQTDPLYNKHFRLWWDTNFEFWQKVGHQAGIGKKHRLARRFATRIQDAHAVNKRWCTFTEGEPYGQLRTLPSLRWAHIPYIAQYSSECLALNRTEREVFLFLRMKRKRKRRDHYKKLVIWRGNVGLPRCFMLRGSSERREEKYLCDEKWVWQLFNFKSTN